MKLFRGMAVTMACMLALFSFLPGARAESDELAGSASDEGIPAWSVARLKVSEGSAWVLAPGESDWDEVDGNAPLPKGARIRVPDDALADIEFSSGNRVRLREGADLELRDLREERTSMTLYEGEVGFRLPDDEFFIPVNITLADGQIVRFPKPGRYSIESGGAGEESTVQVREGEARIKVEEGKYRVRAGEEAYVGEGVFIGRLSEADAADSDPPPPEMTEVERAVEAPPVVVTELREYGEWVNAPTYGSVWRPRVAVGWSPYNYGRWGWSASFGWSWVSSEPWGWYPYRCGNWVDDPFLGWIWTPYRSFASVSLSFGHRSYRSTHYYPATVRFVRESGNVRWIPLRPGERFSRPALPRNDRALTTWRQPVPRQTVFVREPGGRGNAPPRWRDAHVDRPARTPAVRPAPIVRSAPVVVRPVPRRDPDTGRPAPTLRERPTGDQKPKPEDRRRVRDAKGPTKPVEPPRERAGGSVAPVAPKGREIGSVTPAPPKERAGGAVARERSEPARSTPRPEVRPAPERTVPKVAPVERERVPQRERAPHAEPPSMRPAPEERRDHGVRDEDRNRDKGGDRDSDRGGRGGR